MTALNQFRLDGRVAIVTGGAGGIGQVYGRGLAEAGASVVLADLNGQGAEKAAANLASDGLPAIGAAVDITDPPAAAAMARRAIDEFGGIDILVNNAALMAEIPYAPVLSFPIDWWDRVMQVNVTGALICTQACAPSMLERGNGRIINQVSGGAFIGGGVYSASKLALVSLTMTLAADLGPKGVNVNAIAPGFVLDDAGLRALPEGDFRESLTSTVPGKKEGRPEDLVGALLLLASPAGDWINGQVFNVDGGWIMRP
jgi:NAD(P)-dependent dehydrogenase (short-subunit alcohol dehydrogenase family)